MSVPFPPPLSSNTCRDGVEAQLGVVREQMQLYQAQSSEMQVQKHIITRELQATDAKLAEVNEQKKVRG